MERPKGQDQSTKELIATVEEARQRVLEEMAPFEESKALGVEGTDEHIRDLQDIAGNPQALRMYMNGWNAAVGAQREIDAGF
jgi:hypothetical protein